ncbi:laccase-1 [Apiospora marii]|uniref:Laccase-1 n=1 Tax=Apiospora marii TaxID=335849 RepID=A0ABR1RE90_9PEZI
MGLFSLCSGLLGSITPEQQNLKSLWGTLLLPTLPMWLMSKGGSYGVAPWGDRTAEGTNAYTDYPTTGVTRHYEFNITRDVIAPDGYQKSVLLVNGQFPGPLVEANWGDYIEVKVNNQITGDEEGTSMHWHGFLQQDTPWMDGTPGVSQCPIAPGKSFTYKVQATLYGTSWYHAHYSGQYAGGLLGPMVIYGPNHVDYDIDVGPIMVNDWWHKDYHSVIEDIMAPGFRGQTISDNNLIQGKMMFNCSSVAKDDKTPCHNHAGVAKFRFQKGKTHRLRFINTGSQGTERISIDGHTMTVIANDFTPIIPYDTKVVIVGTGQRVDVVVKADAGKADSAFWLRATLSPCSVAKQHFAQAAILYDDADENELPDSKAWPDEDPNTCANDELYLTQPVYPIKVPEPSFTQEMDIGVIINETDHFLWTFDGVSPRVDYNHPTLLAAKEDNLTSFGSAAGIYDYGTNSSIRINIWNPLIAPHPMHAHGVEMYILSQGPGKWDGSTITNANNPLRRDVHMVQGGGHLVVQIDTWNTGLWAFHCHIAWHAAQGFFTQLVFDAHELTKLDIPDSIYQTCREWDDFTSRAVVDQIDSGI